MDSNLLKIGANRAALEEEANALQEAIKREESIVEYLNCRHEEQKSALEANERIASAFHHSTEGITSLQQATKQALQSIEHLQAIFTSILPSQQHPDVAPRIPGTDQFVVDWRVALDCLSNVPNILEQRLGATTEHVHANQTGLAVHSSLQAHATQTVDRMDTVVRDLNRNIEYKRLGVLHPIRRVPCEIFREIFEYAVDEEHAEWMDDKPRGSPPSFPPPSIAFHISATCRHWREIATRIPKLWRYISAPWISHVDQLIGQACFLRSLELAGKSGLELTLRGDNPGCWGPILTEECTKQWSRITIVDPKKLPAQLPTTSRLSMYSSAYGQRIDLPSHLASSLVAILCSGIVPRFTSPATKLTTLDFYIPPGPSPNLGMLLSSLPSLSRLTLDCDQRCSRRHIEGQVVRVHGALEVLSITPRVLPYLANELSYISIPSFSVMKILDIQNCVMEGQILQLFEAANSIKGIVTDLYISSSEVISEKQVISTLILAFSQLKRLELHGFAVAPGLEVLSETGTGPRHMQIVVKDYPEGNEKLREIIEAAGPKASSWTISY